MLARTWRRSFPAVFVAVVLSAACGQSAAGPDPCIRVDCSVHGSCQVDPRGAPYCSCSQGYRAEGLTCVPVPSCPVGACSGHGTCAAGDGGVLRCTCDAPYEASGLDCVPPECKGIDCSGHGRCGGDPGKPACTCDSGWQPDGLECADVASFVAGLKKATCTATGSECGLDPACLVTAGEYVEGTFPGRLDVVLDTVAGVDVNVELFFVQRPTPTAGSFAVGYCEEHLDLRHTEQRGFTTAQSGLGKPGGPRLHTTKVGAILGHGTQFWATSNELTAKYLLRLRPGP